MTNRKEYNDRHSAPLVNPAITHGEYEAQRAKDGKATKIEAKPRSLFIPTIDDREVQAS